MTINVDIKLNNKDLVSLINKYHFENKDLDYITALYRAVTPLINLKCYFVRNKGDNIIKYDDYIACFISLGDGIDELQAVYFDKELVYEAYIIDCLGTELLSKSYKIVVDELQKYTGKYVSSLEFLGDNFDLSLTKRFYEQIKPDNLSYNSGFQLIPTKSVSLIMPLSSKKNDIDICDTCSNCKNIGCTARKSPYTGLEQEIVHSYGYMRIFGS